MSQVQIFVRGVLGINFKFFEGQVFTQKVFNRQIVFL